MSNESAQASRLLRAFAHSSNLLIATRPFRAAPHGDPVARELEALARRIGALPWDDASPRRLEIDVTTGEARLGRERFTRGSSADARLDFALDHMPVSRDLAKGLASSGAARGVRIGVAMTLEPKTANLALLLANAGATVSVYAHPDETDPDVAAALARRGVAIHADATLSGGKEAAAALADLIAAAKADRVKVLVRSGYRSYADQTALLKRKIKEYGDEKLARRYNAEPGKSEHQTGLAVDLWDGVTWGLGVRKTKAGKWLWKHAREYGFILRYPPDKEKITGYAYEPWHFRYIGVEDSMKFKANSKMSLEEYLGLA